MKPEFFLEISSGSGIVPEFICMVILIVYLGREANRRRFTWMNWLSPPPQMDFAIAICIFNLGVLTNSLTVWAWRRIFKAGDFSLAQLLSLGIGRTLIIFGAICMVRALTKPDLGDKPWYLTWLATVIAALMLAMWR